MSQTAVVRGCACVQALRMSVLLWLGVRTSRVFAVSRSRSKFSCVASTTSFTTDINILKHSLLSRVRRSLLKYEENYMYIPNMLRVVQESTDLCRTLSSSTHNELFLPSCSRGHGSPKSVASARKHCMTVSRGCTEVGLHIASMQIPETHGMDFKLP